MLPASSSSRRLATLEIPGMPLRPFLFVTALVLIAPRSFAEQVRGMLETELFALLEHTADAA